MSRLYFINDVPNAVRDNLEGLVTVNNHLAIHGSFNIVVRKDLTQCVLSQGKVALISGGGSGHEPSHAGFIGRGLLTASVSGNIFASPTAAEVLKAIKLVNPNKDSSGALLIVPNYTGDRLHFGSAKEKAALEGYKVDIFVFGDDIVFGSQAGRVGKRGLAGVFFIHKIAGALADLGVQLEKIKLELETVASRIGSISVSLGPCNVPGVGPSFLMPPGQLEVGLGIHGERGVNRISYLPVNRAVHILINHLVGDAAGLNKHFPSDGSPPRIALLFNDNGGLTTMEINVIIKETIKKLVERGFIVERTYSGRYVTSFDMVGVCISMIVVDDHTLNLLDAPCASAIISQDMSLSRTLNNPVDSVIHGNDRSGPNMDYDKVDRLTCYEPLFIKCVTAACQTIIENENLLNKLDSESGDSDCGSTLTLGARAILSTLQLGQLKASFLQLSHIIESCMGGTSGALLSLFFTGASKSISSRLLNGSPSLDIKSWASLISQSIDNMVKYSYAKPGDRTLVDPLDALVKSLKSSKLSDQSDLPLAVKDVRDSAQATASMEAKIGRASYTSQQPNQGPDPGAWAIYLITKATIDQVILNRSPI